MLEQLNETINFIKEKTSIEPRVGITLGSGLSSFAELVDVDAAIPYKDIPHFAPSSVEGHPGQMVIGKLENVPVIILQGRIHFYEGHSMQQVVYPTRVLGKLGIETLIVTNAAGGTNPKMLPGDFMIIKDHINLTGNNPLIGKNIDELGPRFPDMTDPYDSTLRQKLTQILTNKNLRFHEGVYCGVLGPTYETAAEVQFIHKIGGSAVGMSTVPEVIAARHMGLKVCGISCISNLATGISNQKITHDEVKEVAKRVESDFKAFLGEFVQEL